MLLLLSVLFDGGYGILLESEGFNFMNQTGLGESALISTFNNCETGVRVDAQGPMVQFTSQDNLMQNMGTGYSLYTQNGGFIGQNDENKSIINDNFIGLMEDEDGKGISFYNNMGTASFIDIFDNNINTAQDDDEGIVLADDDLLFVHDIDAFDNNIELNIGRNGISIDHCRGAEVFNNTINMGSNEDWGAAGIEIKNDAANNLLQCNDISSTFSEDDDLYGIQVVGSPFNILDGNTVANMKWGISFEEPCNDADVLRNVMESNEIGLEYSFSAITGDQTDHRNIWDGIFDDWGAEHGGNPITSPYRCGAGTQCPPSINITNWFDQGASQNIDMCPLMLVSPNPEVDLKDQLIATTGISLANYTSGYNWNLRRNLYRKLVQFPNLANPASEMSNFKTSYESGTGGELHEIRNEIASLYAISSTDQSTLLNNQNQIKNYLELIIEIDQALTNGNGNVPSLMAQRFNYLNLIKELRQENAAIRNGNIDNRITGAADIISSNNSINPNTDFDNNEKVINNILLLTEVQNQIPTLVQKATVKDIAKMCALEGGLAVYQARALYKIWTGEEIEGSKCIPTSKKDDEEDVIKNTTVQVFPNPANQSIQLILPESEENLAFTLELVSLTGQTLSSHLIPANSISYRLDTNQIPNGIYFLQLIKENSLFKSTKVIIQH